MVLLNLLIKPAWLVLENLLQNRLGHEIWGTYSALSSLAIALTVLTDFGVNQYTIKSLASDTGKFTSWFPALLGFKLLLLLVYPFIILILGFMLGYAQEELVWLMIISLSLAALQLIQFLRSSFQAFQHFRLDSIASVLDKILLILFTLGFLFTGQNAFQLFLGMLVCSTVLSLLVFLLIIFRNYGARGIRFDISFIRRILKLSFPFALISVVYAVHDKIDKVMLEKISGAYENGLYSAAARWVDALMMYTWIIMGLYYARFAKHIRDREKTRVLLKNGQLLGALPMIPAFLILSFAGISITSFLLPDSTLSELRVIQKSLIWLSLSTLINSTFVIYSTLLTATGHERIVTRMVAVSIVIKVLINLIFIPVYGGIAAALATLISFSFLSAAYIYITWKHTQIQVEYVDLLKLGFILLICLGVGLISRIWLNEMYSLAVSLLVFLISAFRAGYLHPSRIKELMH